MPSHLPGPKSFSYHSGFETALSAFMVLFAIGFLLYISTITGTGKLGSYEISARIPSADGLTVGGDVRVSGIKIGWITRLNVDDAAYAANIGMRIRDDLSLPQDSTLTMQYPIAGNPYLSIMPGRSKSMLAPGGLIDQSRKARSRKAVS